MRWLQIRLAVVVMIVVPVMNAKTKFRVLLSTGNFLTTEKT